ncbi:MAG: ATP-binding protein [Bacillota bacterium]
MTVYNLLGHVYKTLSSGFILKALADEAVAGIYSANAELAKKSAELAEMNRQLRMAAAEDRERREVKISVRDTGLGIDSRQRDLIFEMFYQVDGASTRMYGGAGIGLTLAARLAEMHGGRIELESELGRGSCFTVIMPAQYPEEVLKCLIR